MSIIYRFRDDAIQHEIIDPIKASGVVEDPRIEYDLDTIADKVLTWRTGYDSATDTYRIARQGYAMQANIDNGSFWAIVEANHVADGDHRIIWDAPDTDDGTQTARLMRWSSDEGDWIEVDSETIDSDVDATPYDQAEIDLEARNDLHDVTSIWYR